MPQATDFPYLDSIIEEIVEGRRVVLFPPGTGIFIVSNLAFLIGGTVLCAALLPVALQHWITHAGAAQLIGVVMLLPQVVVPAIFVARGHGNARVLMARLQTAWLALSAIGTLVALNMEARSKLTASLLAFTILSVSRFLVSTTTYRVFSVFQQRLHARLAAKRRKPPA
jgi:hypothetical protein